MHKAEEETNVWCLLWFIKPATTRKNQLKARNPKAWLGHDGEGNSFRGICSIRFFMPREIRLELLPLGFFNLWQAWISHWDFFIIRGSLCITGRIRVDFTYWKVTSLKCSFWGNLLPQLLVPIGIDGETPAQTTWHKVSDTYDIWYMIYVYYI